MFTDSQDATFMERALFLAERGRGRTTPNPIVGAVVVSPDGVVVGQGAHVAAGEAHAEIHALDAAGWQSRGATLYCTLEPCSHRGRTGPCVERIVAAGIARAVVAVEDPNPIVHGRGFEYLRTRGIEVIAGVGAAAARRQNAPFRTWVTQHRPHVTLKSATSADGFIGRQGARVRLTGATADRWIHRQRAEVDALAVGADTVIVDDPWLTARGAYRYRPLARVLFDWRLRISPASRVFSTRAAGPVIMVVTAQAAAAHPSRIAELEQGGVIVEQCEGRDLAEALRRLAVRDVLSLVVEGGPTLHTAFAEAGLVDRVERVTTPHTLGDGIPESRAIEAALRAAGDLRTTRLGDDVLIEGDVHRID